MARRRRVLFVDHTARLSGAELALARLLTALSAVDVSVVVGEEGPLVEELRSRGIDVRVLLLAQRTRDRHRNELFKNPIQTVMDVTSYLRRLDRLVRDLKPDIIHTNSMKAHFYGGVAARIRRVPQVWHARDIAEPPYVSRSVARLVRVTAQLLPRVVVCNSHATARSLRARVSGVVMPSPIVDVFEPSTHPRTHASSDALTFVMVGRLAPWKGQHLVLDAFAASLKDTGHRLVLAGSAMFGESEFEQSLVAQIDRLGLSSQVDMVGFVRDIPGLLGTADVLIHYSTSPEPFGQVVVEGMGAGLCVIAAKEGGPEEIVADGVDGILVPPRASAKLARVLTEISQDAELRSRLGSAAVQSSKRYSAEVIGAQTINLYENILADRRIG